MTNQKKYKIFLYCIFLASICGLIAFSLYIFSLQIPDRIILNKDQQNVIDLSVPFVGEINSEDNNSEDNNLAKASGNYITSVNFNGPVTVNTGEEATYNVRLKLFGIFDFKDITMDVVSDQYLYACGMPVGMYLKTEGVLVIDIADFITQGGESVSPCNNILRAGDCILSLDGEIVSTKEGLIDRISKCDGNDLILHIQRNDSEFDVKVKPYKDSTGTYKIGAWVRDDAQGIGTLTFVGNDNRFGALGHGISDADTGDVFEIQGGVLYRANILTVIKGQQGTPGEYIGTIDYSSKNQIGSIDRNCNCGIYGYVSEDFEDIRAKCSRYKVGYRFDVCPGKAYILNGTDTEVKMYEINIEALDHSSNNVNKGIEFSVTDPELLQKTNGIIQGMSGSPIIQNNRIVGAVTHVFINDPTKGYGIFIEEMLDQ